MKIRNLILTGTILVVAHPGYGADLPELIFNSGFEGIESCIVFDGLGDAVIIPRIQLSGDFILNGGEFPQSDYDDATFSLRDRVTGDVFQLANSHDLSYSVNIVPGSYDVVYSVETRGAEAPQNVGAVLMENVELLVSQTLDISVVAHTIGGEFRHNGVLFPASDYDDAMIFLDSETAGQVALGNTHDQSYSSVPILAGDYDVRYQLETSGGTAPRNQWGAAGLVSVYGDDNDLDINVQSVEVSGNFSHNDAPMPVSEYDDGNFYLETADGDRVFLENSHEGSYSRRVITGSAYDIYWELETQGDTVPMNSRARLGTGVSIESGTLNIDMDSYPVSGNFTHNGAAFPNVFQQSGRVLFRDIVAGVDNEVGQTMDGSYDKRLVRSAYEIVYQHQQGDEIPQNRDAKVGSVIVKSAKVVNINVTSVLYGAPVYHNGVLFPAAQDFGNIIVRDPDSDDWALLGKTSQQNLSKRLIPGTYDVYYAHLAGTDVPQNTMARFRKGLVVAPPGPVVQQEDESQLHVNSVQISGWFYVNDISTPASEYDDGEVVLKREDDTVPLGNTHDQSYSVRLINDPENNDFLVHYGVETQGGLMPWNGDSQVMCIVLDPVIF